MEVLGGRLENARALERFSGSLRGRHQPLQHQARPLARRAGQPQMVSRLRRRPDRRGGAHAIEARLAEVQGRFDRRQDHVKSERPMANDQRTPESGCQTEPSSIAQRRPAFALRARGLKSTAWRLDIYEPQRGSVPKPNVVPRLRGICLA